jgi:hypothetical protein
MEQSFRDYFMTPFHAENLTGFVNNICGNDAMISAPFVSHYCREYEAAVPILINCLSLLRGQDLAV